MQAQLEKRVGEESLVVVGRITFTSKRSVFTKMERELKQERDLMCKRLRKVLFARGPTRVCSGSKHKP